MTTVGVKGLNGEQAMLDCC